MRKRLFMSNDVETKDFMYAVICRVTVAPPVHSSIHHDVPRIGASLLSGRANENLDFNLNLNLFHSHSLAREQRQQQLERIDGSSKGSAFVYS